MGVSTLTFESLAPDHWAIEHIAVGVVHTDGGGVAMV
jgi:hypothetical protein